MKHVTYVLLLFYVFVCLFGCDKEPLTKKTGLIIKKWDEPVLKRDKGLLSDPTVIRQGDSLVMYYTNFSLDTDSITFGGSTSQDGISWSPISQKPSFRVFSGDTNSWDKHIETPKL